jgi:hypothetical protein
MGGRVSQEELAKRVGKRAKKSYSQSAAKGWLVDGVVPNDLESQLALALELGVDPGWLYFAGYTVASPPPGADFTVQSGDQVMLVQAKVAEPVPARTYEEQAAATKKAGRKSRRRRAE